MINSVAAVVEKGIASLETNVIDKVFLVMSKLLTKMIIDQDFGGETYKIEVKMDNKDRLRHLAHYPIKSGPRTFKSVNIFEVKASTSGKKVVCFWKSRLSGSFLEVEEETEFKCQPDELEKLIALLDNIEEVAELGEGEHIILNANEHSTEAAIAAIDSIQSSNSEESKELALELIKSVSELESNIDDIHDFAEELPKSAVSVGNLINHARTQKAVTEFQEAINSGESERFYQKFLEDHPWLFGNRYVELKEERKFTRNEEVDFCFETVSGYYDVFEIKKPDHTVMVEDPSHDTYKPSAELSEAVSQTQNYINEIEANHGEILRRDDLNMLKPRGTVVIGADLDSDESEGLRIYNSFLNRIRVMTFSDLVRTGERLIEVYNEPSST